MLAVPVPGDDSGGGTEEVVDVSDIEWVSGWSVDVKDPKGLAGHEHLNTNDTERIEGGGTDCLVYDPPSDKDHKPPVVPGARVLLLTVGKETGHGEIVRGAKVRLADERDVHILLPK